MFPSSGAPSAPKLICSLKRTLSLAILLLTATACQRSVPVTKMVPVRPAPVEDLSFLQRQDVGNPVTDHPWIAHVRAVDLHRNGKSALRFNYIGCIDLYAQSLLFDR